MQLFLILLSLSYLVIEIVFNVHFVNIVYNDQMYLYETLEQWGRHVSSIGATIIFLRLILSKLNKLVTLFLLPFFYFGFFYGQEAALDYITEKTPIESKQLQASAFLAKKGVINGVSMINNLKETDDKESSDNKAFLSSLGFLGFGYPEYLPKIEEDNSILYSKILSRDLVLNTDFHYDQFANSRVLRRDIFRSYKYQYDKLDTKGRYEANKFWEEKEKNEQLFLDNYTKIRYKYRKDREDGYSRHIQPIIDNFYWVIDHCDNSKCSKNYHNKLKEANALNAKELRMNSYNPEKSCIKDGKKGWRFEIITGKGTKLNQGFDKSNNPLSYNGYYCKLDTRKMERDLYSAIDLKYKNEFGTSNFSYMNIDDFVKNGELTKAIKNKIKQDYDISLPSYWKRNDEKTFKKIILNKYKREGKNIVQNKILEQTGYLLPIDLEYDDFFKDKTVLKMLKNELGFFYTGKTDPYSIDNHDKFLRFFEKRYQYDSGKHYQYELRNNEEFVDATFKQTILPVLSISLSLTFGLINFIFIIVGILTYFIKPLKKYQLKMTSGLILLGFFIPLFLNSHYVSQEEFSVIFESMKDKSIILAYYYKWFLNMETILIEILNDFIMQYEFIDALLQQNIHIDWQDVKNDFDVF